MISAIIPSSSLAFKGRVFFASVFAKLAQVTQIRVFRSLDGAPVVPVGKLAKAHALTRQGPFVVQTFKQSGGAYREPRTFDTAQAAIGAAMSACKRAGIGCIVILANEPDKLHIRRESLEFRSNKEGKQLGWIEISRQ